MCPDVSHEWLCGSDYKTDVKILYFKNVLLTFKSSQLSYENILSDCSLNKISIIFNAHYCIKYLLYRNITFDHFNMRMLSF